MIKQQSFTKIESELLPEFRRRIGTAESTEDVKKFYIYTMQELFNRVFSGKIDLELLGRSVEIEMSPWELVTFYVPLDQNIPAVRVNLLEMD